MKYSPEQIEDRYKNLPDQVKEAVSSVETVQVIKKIGQNYHLRIDEMSELADQIGLTMIGLAKPDNFVNELIARIGLDRPVAELIARDVNNQIFLKVREFLQSSPVEQSETAVETNYGVETIASDQKSESSSTESIPNKEEIIGEIEHPKAEDTVFDQKMGKLFRIPREEVDLGQNFDPYNEKPE